MNAKEVESGPGASTPWGELRRLEMGRIVPALATARGPLPGLAAMPRSIGPAFSSRLPSNWEELRSLTIGEMEEWPGVGERKIRAFLAFVQEHCPPGELPGSPLEDRVHVAHGDESIVLSALREIAAWGVANAKPDLVAALEAALAGATGAPLDAVRALAALEIREFAGGERIARWDPVGAARALLDALDARLVEIFRHRQLSISEADRWTLEALGQRFGVTRERIRQLERDGAEKINELLGTDRYRAVRKRGSELATLLGACTPVAALPADVRPDDSHLADELLLWVAGPYILQNGWVVRDRWGTIERIVEEAMGLVGTDRNRAERAALETALVELGVPAPHVSALVEASGLDARDGQLIRWPTGMAARAELVLAIQGSPMTDVELAEAMPEPVLLNSFRNALIASEGLVRVGKGRYALTEWDHESYEGIVNEMREALALREPRPVAELARELAARFGIQEGSVQTFAHSHPAFVVGAGGVSRRGDDQPYLPTGSLDLTASCFVVEGAWAIRIPVDRDLLRGSGRSIPEAFAVHVGLTPGARGSLAAEGGAVTLYWTSAVPCIGSLRAHALALGLEEGDALMVRRIALDRLEILGRLRPPSTATVEAQLLSRIGGRAGVPWARSLASALGFGGVSTPPVAYLRARLEQRGDAELLALMDTLSGISPAITAAAAQISTEARALPSG